MKRLQQFFKTTLLGGLAAVLPLTLLFVFFRWIFNNIAKYLGPIVELFEVNSQIETIFIYSLTVISILAIFFFVGLAIRTRFGNMIRDEIEKNYLMKIPGYKTIKEIVMQFFGSNRSFFTEVVLVDVFDCGTLMTGFITDTQGEYVSVFVPTGPNPTSGNIYHLHHTKIVKSNVSVDAAIKSIISCGAGSSKVFEKIKKPKDQPASLKTKKVMKDSSSE